MERKETKEDQKMITMVGAILAKFVTNLIYHILLYTHI